MQQVQLVDDDVGSGVRLADHVSDIIALGRW